MTRQPSAFRISRWPSVSTPSATTGGHGLAQPNSDLPAAGVGLQRGNEATVDLDPVDRQVPQMVQAGIAAAEVVQGHADALGAQGVQDLDVPFVVQDEDGFGDFQHQLRAASLVSASTSATSCTRPSSFICLTDRFTCTRQAATGWPGNTPAPGSMRPAARSSRYARPARWSRPARRCPARDDASAAAPRIPRPGRRRCRRRLVVQLELLHVPRGERQPQIVLQALPVRCRASGGNRTCSSRALALLQRHHGHLHATLQFLDCGHVRDTAPRPRGTPRSGTAAQFVGRAQVLEQLGGDLGGALLVHIGDADRERVQPAAAHDAAQRPGDQAQALRDQQRPGPRPRAAWR